MSDASVLTHAAGRGVSARRRVPSSDCVEEQSPRNPDAISTQSGPHSAGASRGGGE